jgi:iron complex transport system ATP-binding protein
MERIRALTRGATTLVLVTHHAHEIIPEIDRIILLSRGRVAYDGPKATGLTTEKLSEVFAAPLIVERADGYYHVRVVRR